MKSDMNTRDSTVAFDLQGHRGARGLLPENTLPSFQRAIEIGVRTIELDVVISQDSLVVVSHDPVMSSAICAHPDGRPVTNEEEDLLILYSMRYESIRRFDCGSRGNESFPGQQPLTAYKPLLSEVVELVEQQPRTETEQPIRYNIELKSSPERDGVYQPAPRTFAKLVLDVVVDAGIAGKTTMQSFDPRILQVLRSMEAPVDLALLVGRSEDAGLEANLKTLGFKPSIYSPDYRLVDEQLVSRVHAMDMRLVPWTVNDEASMRHLIELGVDGLITDYPDVAVDVLAQTEMGVR